VVDHAGGAHDPGVGPPIGGAALLGAEQRRLLLCPTDEHHLLGPAGSLERCEPLGHHVVLALSPHEVHPRHVLGLDEAMHRGHERIRDLPQRHRRRNRQAQLAVNVSDQPGGVLQARDVDIEVHPVNRLDLEHHMLSKDIGDGAR
jgi:hypothetical protein